MTRAGIPPTTALSATSRDTTALAATTAFSPMVTPCASVMSAAILGYSGSASEIASPASSR